MKEFLYSADVLFKNGKRKHIEQSIFAETEKDARMQFEQSVKGAMAFFYRGVYDLSTVWECFERNAQQIDVDLDKAVIGPIK